MVICMTSLRLLIHAGNNRGTVANSGLHKVILPLLQIVATSQYITGVKPILQRKQGSIISLA